MTRLGIALGVWLGLAVPVLAACPERPPEQIALQDGETSLSLSQFENTIRGKRIRYSDGAEANYRADGSYGYRAGNTFFEAAEARFYDNGMRCISYDAGQRFDMYVDRAGTLYLVNDRGTRFPARILP